MKKRNFETSDKLLAYVSGCLGLAGRMPKSRVGDALAEELLKPSVASYFRHGEAEGSPTAKEFTEKFKEVLKELRVSRRALYLIRETSDEKKKLDDLLEQADELIRTFFRCIRTLTNKLDN